MRIANKTSAFQLLSLAALCGERRWL